MKTRRLRRATAQALHQLAGLVALATLLAVPLDLPAQVLRDLVDRVQDLGRRLPGPQRRSPQVERRLDDLGIGDARVLLLGQLDLEHRVLRNLPPDAVKPLLHVAAKLVGNLPVPSPDLDPHAPSSRWVAGLIPILRRRRPGAKPLIRTSRGGEGGRRDADGSRLAQRLRAGSE